MPTTGGLQGTTLSRKHLGSSRWDHSGRESVSAWSRERLRAGTEEAIKIRKPADKNMHTRETVAPAADIELEDALPSALSSSFREFEVKANFNIIFAASSYLTSAFRFFAPAWTGTTR